MCRARLSGTSGRPFRQISRPVRAVLTTMPRTQVLRIWAEVMLPSSTTVGIYSRLRTLSDSRMIMKTHGFYLPIHRRCKVGNLRNRKILGVLLLTVALLVSGCGAGAVPETQSAADGTSAAIRTAPATASRARSTGTSWPVSCCRRRRASPDAPGIPPDDRRSTQPAKITPVLISCPRPGR